MKLNKLIILIFVALLLISLGLYIFDINRIYDLGGKRDKSARTILEEVAVWFIKEGLSEYYKGKDLSYIEEYVKNYDAYLHGEILIDKNGYLAQIIPNSWWVRSTITCYSRVADDFLYEYWVVDRFGGTRTDVDREIYFIIAKSKGKDKKREIIHRTEKFFPEFSTPEGTLIRFPRDNESIYRLRAWKFPDAFKGTELEGIEVVIDENKEYVRKKTK
jgi:hypothetical protein